MDKFKWEWDESIELLDVVDGYLASKICIENANVLEVGTYKGGWICTVLKNNPSSKGVAIDPYPKMNDIKKEFKLNLTKNGLNKKVKLFSDVSKIPKNILEGFHLIHIDGEHSESAVYKDLDFAFRYLKNDGCIIVDDVFYREFPGVASAVFTFIMKNEISPFLLSRKKIYLCKPKYFKYYRNLSMNILKNAKIDVENVKKNSEYLQIEYDQSNDIMGYSPIIVKTSFHEQKFFKLVGISNKKTKLRDWIKMIAPPIIILFIKKIREYLKKYLTQQQPNR